MKPHEIKHLARQTLSDKPSQVDDIDPEETSHDGIESLRVERMENGYSIHTNMKPKVSKDGGIMASKDRKPHFAKDHNEVADHVRKVLGNSK